MQEPKALIKDTFLFLICGIVIQFILYKSIQWFIEAEQVWPAFALLVALSINGLIFFVGCMRKVLILFDEMENIKKGK